MIVNKIFKTVIVYPKILVILGGIQLLLAVWILYTNYIVTNPIHLSPITAILILALGLLQVFFAVKNKQQDDIWHSFMGAGLVCLLLSICLFFTAKALTEDYLLCFYVLFSSINTNTVINNLKGYGIVDWQNSIFLSYSSLLIVILILFGFTTNYSMFPHLAVVILVNVILILNIYFKIKRLNTIPEKLNRSFYKSLNLLKREYAREVKN